MYLRTDRKLKKKMFFMEIMMGEKEPEEFFKAIIEVTVEETIIFEMEFEEVVVVTMIIEQIETIEELMVFSLGEGEIVKLLNPSKTQLVEMEGLLPVEYALPRTTLQGTVLKEEKNMIMQ